MYMYIWYIYIYVCVCNMPVSDCSIHPVQKLLLPGPPPKPLWWRAHCPSRRRAGSPTLRDTRGAMALVELCELLWLSWTGWFGLEDLPQKKMEPAQMQILADLVGGKNLLGVACCFLVILELICQLSMLGWLSLEWRSVCNWSYFLPESKRLHPPNNCRISDWMSRRRDKNPS